MAGPAAFVFIPDPAGLDSLMRVNGPVGRALKDWASSVEMLAKSYAPVDSGALRDSIHIVYSKSEEGIEATIGTDVEYAGFQEFGTTRNVAHPYLRPALFEVMQLVVESGVSDFGGSVTGGYSYDGGGDYSQSGSDTVM